MTWNLSLLSVLFLLGCTNSVTGYPFKIQAIYQAPRSGVQITVVGQGQVAAGADLSEKYQGTVLIEPLSEGGKTVQLAFTGSDQVTYTIDSSGHQRAAWEFRHRERCLTSILAKADYPRPDPEEIAELVRVIGGVFAGPKAVTLAGQSELLKVVETRGVHGM